MLVVGLGNPGKEYEKTRHNAGQRVVELLAERHGISLKKAQGKGIAGHGRVGPKLLALCLPGTFMNESGEGVAPLVRRYGIDDMAQLIVVHDELDLPVERIQLKLGGGLAGHNGLKSIKAHLKTDEFARVRVGVGRPPGQGSGSSYVLKAPSASERKEAAVTEERAADAVEAILTDGIAKAMNTFNS